MKKTWSAVVLMLGMFAFPGTSAALYYDYGMINSPSFLNITNFTDPSQPSADPDYIPFAAGSFTDIYDFQVDLDSNFGFSATSINVSAFGLYSSFNSALYWQTTEDGNPWALLTSDVGIGTFSNHKWDTALFWDPLTTPTKYRLEITGTKLQGHATYEGNISVAPLAPIPEPEIYAMLVAGLGLMGFVARRRQRNGMVS